MTLRQKQIQRIQRFNRRCDALILAVAVFMAYIAFYFEGVPV